MTQLRHENQTMATDVDRLRSAEEGLRRSERIGSR